MLEWRMILVPAFLLAQALLVLWGVGGERLPVPPRLSSFPSAFGEWKQVWEDQVAADLASELRADQLLNRTYVHAPSGSLAGLFVAWFQSQRAGTSQPHSPKVCLPASGWTPALSGVITLHTAAGAITVNRYVVASRGQRNVVLYWYQGPDRITAGEWETKLWLMAEAFWKKRTDTALIRVVVQSANGNDQAAIAAATGFAQNLYPVLREALPR